jgi:hypothetical protein
MFEGVKSKGHFPGSTFEASQRELTDGGERSSIMMRNREINLGEMMKETK